MSSPVIDAIDACLASIHGQRKVRVAYSGGIDSSVLLHAASLMAKQGGHVVQAIHINHQLHQDSSQWSQHCLDYCQALNVPLTTIEVNVQAHMQHGLEGAARAARYAAFAEALHEDDVLLTAHHADDQVETLLLQLLRGAGPGGLSGCAAETPFAEALLLRPLLNVTRQEIEYYAKQNDLDWLEDPSNQSTQYNRNYLRHEVIPVLQQRWPQLQKTISRSAQWQLESVTLMDELAAIDLSTQDVSSYKLNVHRILPLSYSRKKNALRFWIRQYGYPLPSAQILEHIINDVLLAAEDAEPCVRWQDCELRKYKEHLYLQKQLPEHDPMQVLEWQIQQPLKLLDMKMTLTQEALASFGISLAENQVLQVRFRQGGEVMRPRGRGCQKTLKVLFQEASVPPWLRDRIPLLFQDGRLICVWGFWVAEEE
jgi:tRNA(Ile)-lysidine synthase